MTAPAPAQEPAAPATPAPPAPAAPVAPATPPWGSDDQFDPAKAWSLIEALRADKEKLSARPVLTPEQQQQLEEYQTLVEASKSEQQRKDEALAAANQQLAQATSETARYKAAATHHIDADYFDLLGTGTEDEVMARAAKLAELLKTPETPAQPGAPATRPIEQMRPGATPTGQEPEDEVTWQRLFGAPH